MNFRIISLSAVFCLALRLGQIFVIITVTSTSIMLHSEPLVFRFHIHNDPESLDPANAPNPLSSYVLNALYSPLLSFQDGQLVSGGAKACRRLSALHYRCELRNNWYWTDGVPVDAAQIVEGFVFLKAQKTVNLNSFLNIKDLKLKSKFEVDFYLKNPDSGFIYKLLNPALGPRRKDVDLKAGKLTYGPYSLSTRIAGRSLYLVPNKKFFIAPNTRPDIEVLIVDSDSTALRLYQTKELNFLRRLTVENIPEYKNTAQFMQRPLHRMDYIGLGPELDSLSELREKLIYSLEPQFKKFVEIFAALGRPGCFGLEKSIVGEPICAETKAVAPYSTETAASLPKLLLYFSLSGGDDISRVMEFFQAGWKKNANINVELRPTEQGVLTQMLSSSPPTLFRRGEQLESPTCLAALEIFESSSLQNYPRLKSSELDSVVNELRRASSPNDASLCRRGLLAILKTHRIIPMGPIHFTMLNDLNFSGFAINELNQLDVTRLTPKAAKTKVR